MGDKEKSNDASGEKSAAITIYENRSKNSQISYIVLIGFSLFFLFLILFPYISLKYSVRNQSDEIFSDSLSNIVAISNEYSNISNGLINQIVVTRESLKEDYDKLDKYFGDIETVESLYAGNISPIQSLALPTPLFMKCGIYPIGNKSWGDCNADITARKVAANSALTLQPVIDKLDTAKNQSLTIKGKLGHSIDILLNNKTIVPTNIEESDWENLQNILISLKYRVTNLQLKINQSVDYVTSSRDNLWQFMYLKEKFSGIATSQDLQQFNAYIDSLRNEKEKVGEEFTNLSNRLDEIEAPYIGKVSLGLSNAIGIFPFALGAGFLACSYLASQCIRARAILQGKHEKYSHEKFDRHIFPLWIEPLVSKTAYFQLSIFSFIPLIVFVLSSHLITSVAYQVDGYPLFQFSPWFNQNILLVSIILSSALFITGVAIIIWEILNYWRLSISKS